MINSTIFVPPCRIIWHDASAMITDNTTIDTGSNFVRPSHTIVTIQHITDNSIHPSPSRLLTYLGSLPKGRFCAPLSPVFSALNFFQWTSIHCTYVQCIAWYNSVWIDQLNYSTQTHAYQLTQPGHPSVDWHRSHPSHIAVTNHMMHIQYTYFV